MSKYKSLAQWLEQEGADLLSQYADEWREAKRAAARAGSAYGQSGETLARQGLLGSGYAAYLDGVAYAAGRKAEDRIRDRYAASAEKNYAAYLSGVEKDLAAAEKKRTQSIDRALSRLLSASLSDYDDALAAARLLGLNDDDAAGTAQAAVALNKDKAHQTEQKRRRNILDRMISLGLRRESGRAYAMALGMDETEADLLAELAESTYRAKKLGYTSYNNLELLREYYQSAEQ